MAALASAVMPLPYATQNVPTTATPALPGATDGVTINRWPWSQLRLGSVYSVTPETTTPTASDMIASRQASSSMTR